jgi:ABC-2 type transport system ATP-binding protein
MDDPVLEVKNLSKNFGTTKVVENISFAVPRGKVIGLLGPNGAGKTTTIHMLLGITTASSGDIFYFGKDFFKNRQTSLQRINFTSAYNSLQGRISVWENLLVFAYLYGLKNPKQKIYELTEYFGIKHMLKQRFWDLSAGERTRVNIAKSILNDPELLLMDEPTASLDPDIAEKVLSLIEELRRDRKISILYTSHDMDEVTRVCDEVIFLDKGKIVAQDSPLGLTKRIDRAVISISFDGKASLVEDFLKSKNYKFELLTPFIVRIDSRESEIVQTILGINRLKIEITDIEIKKATLEDFFIEIARGKKDRARAATQQPESAGKNRAEKENNVF